MAHIYVPFFYTIEGVNMINFIAKITDITMKTPTIYGWFHFLYIIIAIIGAIFIIKSKKEPSEKRVLVFRNNFFHYVIRRVI